MAVNSWSTQQVTVDREASECLLGWKWSGQRWVADSRWKRRPQPSARCAPMWCPVCCSTRAASAVLVDDSESRGGMRGTEEVRTTAPHTSSPVCAAVETRQGASHQRAAAKSAPVTKARACVALFHRSRRGFRALRVSDWRPVRARALDSGESDFGPALCVHCPLFTLHHTPPPHQPRLCRDVASLSSNRVVIRSLNARR